MEYSLATLMMNIVNDEKLNIEKTILHPLFCKYNRQAENYVSDFTGTSLINQIRKKIDT